MQKLIKLVICSFLAFVAIIGLTTGTAFAQSQSNDIVVINGERYRVFPEVNCSTERQYFPNESDAGSFYQCSNGVPIYQPCPAGLIFNPDINVCDYPQNYEYLPSAPTNATKG